MASDPQKQFFNSQDIVSPDVEQLYTSVVKEIDRFRSRFNAVTNFPVQLTEENINDLFINSESESLEPQESRCNAFYRMMGLPVVSADGSQLYSPGHDPDLNRDSERLKSKLDIINSLLNNRDLNLILINRELFYQTALVFFQLQNVNATADALASIHLRPFGTQLKNGLGPLEVDNQEFLVSDRNFISTIFNEDISLDTISKHILKPFIVDPRVELTVVPAANRICAPFLSDKSKTQLSKNTFLKRPYIERVIRVRFDNRNVTTSTDGSNAYVDDLISFIKTNSDVTSPILVDLSADKLKSMYKSELMIFGTYIRLIGALLEQLVTSINEIQKIQREINWKPIPDKRGPEFGCMLNKVNIKDRLNNKQKEVEISTAEMKKILSENEFSVGIVSPDLGNFTFSNIDDMVFGSLKNKSDFYEKQIKNLNKQRDELGNIANSHLRKIEIIMGEFSGLGLLDIFAIQAAFWLIGKPALLGLIDSAAIARGNLGLEDRMPSPIDALSEFEQKLSEIYKLIEAFYQNILAVNGKNSQ